MTVLFLRALHIIFVVTWFAGLFYIVRLFIYQTEANDKEEPDRTILLSEYQRISKLLWYMITWPFSGAYVGIWAQLAAGLSCFPWLVDYQTIPGSATLFVPHLCHYIHANLQRGVYLLTSFQLRIWNEVATLLSGKHRVPGGFEKCPLDMTYGLLGLVIFGVLLMSAVHLL